MLAERAILTRAVCRELLESSGRFDDQRPCVALSFLLQWIQETLPESLMIQPAAGGQYQREPYPADGIDLMVVPEGCQDLLQEIRDGAQVAQALFMLLTADTPSQAKGDEAVIRDRLTAYWANHASPVRAPSVIECWSGFPKGPP